MLSLLFRVLPPGEYKVKYKFQLVTYCALFKFTVNRVDVDRGQVHQVDSLVDVVKKSFDMCHLRVKVDWSLELYKLG